MRDLCFITNDGYSMYCSEITGIKVVEDNFEVTAKVFVGVYGQEILEMSFLVDKWSLMCGINGLIMETPTSAPTAKNTPENSELLGEEEEEEI
jgi:hypothetical protein